MTNFVWYFEPKSSILPNMKSLRVLLGLGLLLSSSMSHAQAAGETLEFTSVKDETSGKVQIYIYSKAQNVSQIIGSKKGYEPRALIHRVQ